jgi:hypothetical protein
MSLGFAQQKIFLGGRDTELNGIPAALLQKYKTSFLPVVYQFAIDPDDKIELRPDLLRKEIERFFPDRNAAGICVLDWEGNALVAISDNEPGTPLYEKAKNLFIEAMNVVRAFRPNVKVGMFGINRVDIYKRDDAWVKKNDKMLPIYQASDILFPQVYHYYPYPIHDANFDKQYVTDMMKLMIAYGTKLNKPVYAFIWHRYFDGEKSIDATEFYNHTLFAMQTKVSRRGIDGVVLWTGDEFWIGSKYAPVVSEQGNMSSEEFRQKNLNLYLGLMHKARNGN